MCSFAKIKNLYIIESQLQHQSQNWTGVLLMELIILFRTD